MPPRSMKKLHKRIQKRNTRRRIGQSFNEWSEDNDDRYIFLVDAADTMKVDAQKPDLTALSIETLAPFVKALTKQKHIKAEIRLYKVADAPSIPQAVDGEFLLQKTGDALSPALYRVAAENFGKSHLPLNIFVLSDGHAPGTGYVPQTLRRLFENKPRAIVTTINFTRGGERSYLRRTLELMQNCPRLFCLTCSADRTALKTFISCALPSDKPASFMPRPKGLKK